MSNKLLGLPSLSSLGGSAWSSGSSGGWGSSNDGGFYNFKVNKGSSSTNVKIPANHHGGGGLLGGVEGFFSNLGHDVKDTATGFIPGVAYAVQHPEAAGKAILNDYKTRYWTNIEKHGFGGFLHDVYMHPLSYALDAATVGSFGLGAASRLAKVGALGDAARGSKLADLSRATTTELRSSRLEGAAKTPFTYSSKPQAHLRQAVSIAIAKKIPDVGSTLPRVGQIGRGIPFISESSRAGRAIKAAADSKNAHAINAASTYLRLTKNIKEGTPMATAVHAFIRRVAPQKEFDWLQSQGAKLPKFKADALTNPKANKLYHDALNPAVNTAEAKHIRSIHLAVQGMAKHEAIVRGLGEDITGPRALLHHQIMAGHTTFDEAGNIIGGASKDSILKGLAHEGALSEHFPPAYFPDKPAAALNAGERAVYNRMGQSLVKNHQNRAVLHRLGLLSDNPHLYGSRYLGTVRAAHAVDMKSALEKIALSHQGPLPKGFSWLKNDTHELDKSFGKMATEMAGHSKMTAKEAMADLQGRLVSKDLHSGSLESHGHIVPNRIVDQMVHSYGAEHNYLKNLTSKSYSLWKKIVLYSPRFVSNTFLGNGVLYALHHGGPRGLHAVYNAMLREDRPSDVAAMLGKDRLMHRGEKLLQDLAPEHAATFTRDITGDVTYQGGAKGKLRSLMNLPFKATHAHEQFMRRATLIKAIYDTPEFRAQYRKLKRQGIPEAQAFDQAARNVAKHEPGLAKEWGRQIDNVMGNYRSYNAAEEKLRSIAPFYGWNRHAMRSSLTLAAEKPGRATLANQFGDQGNRELQKLHETLPTYMGTYIPLPGMLSMIPGLDHNKREGFLDTKGLNPLATVGDTVEAVKGLVQGKPGGIDPNTLSLLNPAITSLYGAISGQNMGSGAKLKGGIVGGLLGNAAQQFTDGLPPVRLLEAMTKTGAFAEPNPNDPKNMYTPTGRIKAANIDPNTGQVKIGAGKQTMLAKNPGNQLINLLGLPVKEVNRDLAQTQRTKQDTQTGDYFHAAKTRKPRKKKNTVNWGNFK